MKQKRKRRKRRYQSYDYEAYYDQSMDDLDEWFIEQLIQTGQRKSVYATKEIYAGDQLEVEIYPEFTRRQAKEELPEEVRKKRKESQRNLNEKNSRKEFCRTAEHNFHEGDLWITLTYQDEYLPKTEEEAQNNIQRYFRNINGKRKRRGLGNAKYMYVTEWIPADDQKPVRCHHHILMDAAMEMDIVEGTWKYGRRNNCRKIHKDENGISGMSNYMTKITDAMVKRPEGKKRWSGSTNLEKPPVKKHHKTRTSQVRNMVKNPDTIKEFLYNSKRYPEYVFTDSRVYYNDINGGYYIYARMRRKGGG